MTKVLVVTSLENTLRLMQTVSVGQLIPDVEIVISNHVTEFDYDRGISFMYQRRVLKKELEKPWINFHPGPLPEYKGRNVIYQAMMNGEKYFGASVHFMDDDFDTGPIIEVAKFPISPSWVADDVWHMTMEYSYILLEKWFVPFASGLVFPAYDNTGGTYYQKEPIDDFIEVDEMTLRKIRAITFKKYYPKIKVGDRVYKIVRDDQ